MGFATFEEAFDATVAHLRRQGRRAIDGGLCACSSARWRSRASIVEQIAELTAAVKVADRDWERERQLERIAQLVDSEGGRLLAEAELLERAGRLR